jgi:hypothetical protein
MILDVYEIQKFFEVDENESIEFEFKVTEWYEMPTKKRIISILQ